MASFRISFGVRSVQDKPDHIESHVFWTLWTIIVWLGAIIMLNFIIAEVSGSYEKVNEMIENITYKERAILVKEAEDFITQDYKNQHKEQWP